MAAQSSVFGGSFSDQTDHDLDTASEETSDDSDSETQNSVKNASQHEAGPSGPIHDESEDDESSDDDAPTYLKPRSKKANQWKYRTRAERGIARTLFQHRRRDLTRHLLAVHGLERPRRRIKGDEIRFKRRWDWTKKPPRLNRVRGWTNWPLRPERVPRRKEQVWSDSLHRKDKSTPSTHLEEDIFAFALRKSRSQWQGDELNDDKEMIANVENLNNVQDLGDSSSSSSSEGSREATEDADKGQPPITAQQKVDKISTTWNDDADRPVISTDDDHTRRLLQPMIRSTLSDFDQMLRGITAMELNAKLRGKPKNLKKKSKSHGRSTIMPGAIDWSQVLSVAAISGISPEVISRATARCAALFNEGMTLQTLDPDAPAKESNLVHTFTPRDIHSKNVARTLIPKHHEWDPQTIKDGCPINGCPHPRPSPGNDWPLGKALKHMYEVHGWTDLSNPPADAINQFRTIGGVKQDGFLTPIDKTIGFVPELDGHKRQRHIAAGRQFRQETQRFGHQTIRADKKSQATAREQEEQVERRRKVQEERRRKEEEKRRKEEEKPRREKQLQEQKQAKAEKRQAREEAERQKKERGRLAREKQAEKERTWQEKVQQERQRLQEQGITVPEVTKQPPASNPYGFTPINPQPAKKTVPTFKSAEFIESTEAEPSQKSADFSRMVMYVDPQSQQPAPKRRRTEPQPPQARINFAQPTTVADIELLNGRRHARRTGSQGASSGVSSRATSAGARDGDEHDGEDKV